MVDGSPLIPTIAIRSKKGSPKWVFGREAANLKPDGKMEVFQNWKSDLFRPRNDRESAAAIIVAEHFFGWLKNKIESADIKLSETNTRVAMPAFDKSDEIALVVARCMELNDWESPLILRATEPHANTVGLFSKGQNVVSCLTDGRVNLNYGAMFGPQNIFVQTARSYVLQLNNRRRITAVVIDIGAFTTDLAELVFDVTAPGTDIGDGLQSVRQQSYTVGVINELDGLVFKTLAARHKLDWTRLSFREAELMKHALYQGSPYNLLIEPRGQVRLGDAEDRALISQHIEQFAKMILEKVAEFIERHLPAIFYLTGGGGLIPGVAGYLHNSLSRRGVGSGQIPDVGPPSVGGGRWRGWQDTGEGLHRIATALGGASVILEASADTRQQRIIADEERPFGGVRRSEKVVECRCRAGNKDCCFCGGTGYYLRG